MTDLSPAARAVFESFNSKFDWVEDGVPGPQLHAIAAALRAAADQVVPKRSMPLFAGEATHADWFARDDVRDNLLRIAAELEGAGAE